MSNREKTAKLDEVMNRISRGINEESPLGKLMEDASYRLVEQMKQAEVQKMLAHNLIPLPYQ